MISVRFKSKIAPDDMVQAAVRGLTKAITRIGSDAQRISRTEHFRKGFKGGAPPIPGKLTTREGAHGLWGTVRFIMPTVSGKLTKASSRAGSMSGGIFAKGTVVTGVFGADRPYARIHEFGGKMTAASSRSGAMSGGMPARPYLQPALDKAVKRNWDVLMGVVAQELRRGG